MAEASVAGQLAVIAHVYACIYRLKSLDLGLVLEFDNIVVFLFFFSSRRRHTRLQGDWSSDVCSSDLSVGQKADVDLYLKLFRAQRKESFAVLVANAQIVKTALDPVHFDLRILAGLGLLQIGRASCRERVWIWAGGRRVKERE